MRVSVQGCLILGLCLLSSAAYAEWTRFSIGCNNVFRAEDVAGCAAEAQSIVDGFDDPAYWFHPSENYPGRYEVWAWDGEPTEAVADCDTYNCNFQPAPSCDSPNFIDPDTGECRPPQHPEECYENGEYYNPRTQQCVTECPSGTLDNQCLAEPETECDESSSDYQGTVGWGDNHRPVCGGDNQCQDDETYAFRENDEGSWSGQCISNDSNPPVCPKGFEGALVITDGGFACEGLNPDPDNPDDPNDTSDGDSDGDGEGDTTGITEQLQDIKSLLSGGNTERTNIKNKLDGIGQSIKDGTSSITDAIGEIPGGGGGSGDGDGDGDGDGETEDPVTWNGDPIDTELTDPTDDYDQVMADYQAKINEIKGEVQAMFSTNLTGGGSVDDNIKTIKGEEVNFSLNRFLSGLDILGAIVLFCAAFISAGILFTSRG